MGWESESKAVGEAGKAPRVGGGYFCSGRRPASNSPLSMAGGGP